MGLEAPLASLPEYFSGVNGEEFRLMELRGEGVRGTLPPTLSAEKSPLWVLTGVDTAAVAMMFDISNVVSRGVV